MEVLGEHYQPVDVEAACIIQRNNSTSRSIEWSSPSPSSAPAIYSHKVEATPINNIPYSEENCKVEYPLHPVCRLLAFIGFLFSGALGLYLALGVLMLLMLAVISAIFAIFAARPYETDETYEIWWWYGSGRDTFPAPVNIGLGCLFACLRWERDQRTVTWLALYAGIASNISSTRIDSESCSVKINYCKDLAC